MVTGNDRPGSFKKWGLSADDCSVIVESELGDLTRQCTRGRRIVVLAELQQEVGA